MSGDSAIEHPWTFRYTRSRMARCDILPTVFKILRPTLGLLLCSFLLGASSSRKSDWQILALGMEFRYITAIHPSPTGDSRIAVLRIDPKLWKLEAVGTSQTGESLGHTAKE